MEIKFDKSVYFGMVLLIVIMLAGTSSAEKITVEQVGSFGSDREIGDAEVVGNYAYVLQLGNLVTLSVTDPTNPVEVNRITPPPNTGFDSITSSDNYVYVTASDYSTGTTLMVYDITNPATPKLVGQYNEQDEIRIIEVSDNYAYLLNHEKNYFILDVSNPADPKLVGQYALNDYITSLDVSGQYLYLTASVDYETGSLIVIDISDPKSPIIVGQYSSTYYIHDVAVSGQYAYLANDKNGLIILDISDPTLPQLVGKCSEPGSNIDQVIVSGEYAYVLFDLNPIESDTYCLGIVNISDPKAPQFADRSDGYSGHSFFSSLDGCGIGDVSGNYIYMVPEYGGLAILRMSTDPGTESPAPSPSPSISSVDIEPLAGVNEGDVATIDVSVINNGGPSNEGYISVSFPNNEEVIEVSGTGNGYNKLFPIGSTLYGRTGSMTAVNPVAGLSESSWATGQTESLTIKVKPNTGSSKIDFQVRASLKDASGNNVRTPASSANTDQQGWYVDVYSINVYSIADVTPPASVQNLQQSEVEQTRIRWTWTNPSDADFSHVMVYIDGAFMTTTSETYYELTGLTEGTTHTIGLQTVDTTGNINPEIVGDDATTSAILPEITSVSGKDITSSSITLEWTASSDTTRVQIFRDNVFVTDVSGSTSYVDSNLESDKTYSYTLVPYNNVGLKGTAVTIDLKTSSSGSSGSGGGGSGSSSSSESNSGGGGGGGAGSVEDYANVAVKDVDRQYLTMDSNAIYEFTQEGNPIQSVSFYSLKNSGEITSTIEVLNGRSKLVKSDPDDYVYKYANIWVGKAGFATESNIKDAKIKFKVDDAWLQTMDLSPEDVRLQVYNSNANTWQVLPTTYESTTMDYEVFDAQTTAFGPFAITAEKTFFTLPTEPDGSDEEEKQPGPNDEEETQPEKTGIWTLFNVVILIGIVAVGYMYMKKD